MYLRIISVAQRAFAQRLGTKRAFAQRLGTKRAFAQRLGTKRAFDKSTPILTVNSCGYLLGFAARLIK